MTSIDGEAHETPLVTHFDLSGLLPLMFRHFESDGLRYVVMRNHEGYPLWGYKPDIGLLIDDRDIGRLISLFRRTCNELGYVFVRGKPRWNSVILYAVRVLNDPAYGERLQSIKIDARTYESFSLAPWHRRLHPFNYKVFLDDARRRQVVQVNCAFHVYEPMDSLIMLFKQWRRKRTEWYRTRIIELLGSSELFQWFCQTTDVAPGDPQEMLSANYDEAVHDVWLWRMVEQRYGRSTAWRMVRTNGRALIASLKQLRLRKAPMIYFTGPDGSGKSTVVESVKHVLVHGVIGEPVRFRHFYSLKNVLVHVTRRFWWLKAGRAPAKGGEAKPGRIDNMMVRDRDTGRPSWRVRKRLALLVGLLDIHLSYVAAWWCRWRGMVVLVETSPYDAFVKYHMPEFPWIERIFAPLLPRPSVCLVLRADSQGIVQRKPELTTEEIEDFYDRVDRVIRHARVEIQTVSVPTDVSQASTFALAAREIAHQIGKWRIGTTP